ncbi:MAG: sulfatase-like hydrolase/transferase, partial [Pirellulales bacterium]|nr:sulfatase-like hydrolase/transferase [Pirellulales bacterium]
QTKELWRDEKLVEKPFENRLLTEKFTREAVGFIDRNKDKPFLLYLPYTAPHFPVQAHPDWKGRSEFGVYGDVVEEMDHRIGEIHAALAKHELEEHTIVVFLSDNGPQPGEKALAKPFRGAKWDALEGGTRVPCIVSWPGKISAGRESDAIVAAIDLLPTLAHACGIDLEEASRDSHKIDGVNVWATLSGEKDVPHARRVLLYWHGMNGFHAIRVGQWKLFLAGKDTKLPGHKQSKAPVLFDLVADPAEKRDVSDRHPEKVREMRVLAEKRLADINRDVVPLGD